MAPIHSRDSRTRRWLGAVALLLAAAVAAPDGAAAPARASQLLGKVAQDARGKDVGELRDLVIDTSDGRIAQAVLSVGAYVGGGTEKLVAIPLPSPQLRLDGERLVVTAARAELAAMAGFTSAEWPDPNLDQPAGTLRYRRASAMIDAPLKDRAGKVAGVVKDLMVSLDEARLDNVVVEFDPAWHEKRGWIALPRTSVAYGGQDLVANFDPDDMRTPAEAEAARQRAEQARAQAAAAAASVDRDERASRVIGRKVVDAQGAALGEVRDLVADTRNGRLTHLVVALDAARLAALPLPLPDATRQGDQLVVDRAQLAALPTFAPDRWPDWNAQQKGQPVRRVTALLDTRLADAEGDAVGVLRDIVVNLGGARVRYAVAEFDPTWVQPGKLAAVPLRGVAPGARDPDDLRMRVGLHQLQGAMIFDQGGWPDLNNPAFRAAMDRYLAATR